MATLHTNLQKTPITYCFYDATYYSAYQPSYGVNFVFYDEEEYESSDWTDNYTPLLPGSGIRH